jgi:hypothetical protein
MADLQQDIKIFFLEDFLLGAILSQFLALPSMKLLTTWYICVYLDVLWAKFPHSEPGQLRTESVATLPPFGPIEGQKWFDRISSQ